MLNIPGVKSGPVKIKPSYLLMQPHHIWCLQNFVGYGHHPKQINSWHKLSRMLKVNPDIKVKMVETPDSLCLGCPSNTDNAVLKCNTVFVQKLNATFKKLLDISTGGIYYYKDLIAKLKNVMTPQKRQEICGECHFFKFGICKDVFQKTI